MTTKAEDNKKFITDKLLSVKREGMEDLVKYMDEIGFFNAPASGGNHECCEGGLAQHTTNVMVNAYSIAGAVLYNDDFKALEDSIIVVSAIHDLGKCGDHGKALYIPNILKSGKQSEAKPYARNKELTAIPHSVRSIKLATLFIDLTDDEEWAIYAHDGLYDHAKYIIPGHETPLLMIVHWADMWASQVQEIKKGENK